MEREKMDETLSRTAARPLPNLAARYRAEHCLSCEGPQPCAVVCPAGVDVARLVRHVAEAVRQGLLPLDWFATDADRADAYIEDCVWASYNIS